MGFMSNPAQGGDFDPYLKMNAKAGRFYTKNDQGEEYEVTNMTAIFDMDQLKTGWFLFAAGTAPVKQYDPSLSEAAPKPGEGFKRGFELLVYSEKNLGGRREFSSTAGAVIDAMNELYDAWQADLKNNIGKLPVVQCTGVTPVTGKHGTNYRPVFAIVSWADRPTDLPLIDTAQRQPAAAAPAASASPATHMPPPQAAAPAAAGAPDF